MDDASEAILALKPVMFRYKKELDPERRPQFGLLAEDVEKLNRDLVVRDSDGKLYTVRYDAINRDVAQRVSQRTQGFPKRAVQSAGAKSQDSGARSDYFAAKGEFPSNRGAAYYRFDEQASQIQKVSAQLEANKPAPQVVNNP